MDTTGGEGRYDDGDFEDYDDDDFEDNGTKHINNPNPNQGQSRLEEQQEDAGDIAPSESSAALERHMLEVASLEEKLETQAEELRESQRRQESLEAKLDEKEQEARRVAEEHKERIAELKRSPSKTSRRR